MAGCCAKDHCSEQAAKALNSTVWRRALWIALLVNGGMFAAEMVAGLASGSASLQADALDFLGDAATYALSLGVAGLGLAWRAGAALVKGWGLLMLGLWVIASTGWHAYFGTLPEAQIMGVVGFVALVANAAIALMLYQFRTGDSNMRSVWICSRNDVIGNIAVMGAAAGVFGTGTSWPDLIVAAIMASLSMSGGWQILRQARTELNTARRAAAG
ncbi:MAG: cation transporter [Rhodospirillaceae bacterium]|nr:cation transporter [Rhodospirillaceae bacterium]